MPERYPAPLTTIALSIGLLVLAGSASAQTGSADAYAESYVSRCALLTGTDRLACFDQLPWRISGNQGQRYSWLGNTASSAAALAAARSAQQFMGTSQRMPERPFAFIDTTSPL